MNAFPSAYDAQGLQFIWNSTSLKLVEECLYKYYLEVIEGWSSPEKSVHIIFGGHYATALEHFYKHRALGMNIDEALREVIRETMIASWDAETKTPWTSHDPNKTRENLIRSIIWYVDQFADEPITVMKTPAGQPMVEHTFLMEIDNGWMFSGHIDRMVEYGGQPYVMDQKTTKSTITNRYFEGFSPDVQMSLYTFAGRAVFDIPVKGVIIDAAQIAVGFTRFERGFTMRTEAQLNEWYDTSLYHIETARTAAAVGYFPQNRTACGNYGGCPFRSACSRDPAVREQFLKATFEKRGRREPLEPR